jgi:uncharacterized protein YoaH (UPF0181 family)
MVESSKGKPSLNHHHQQEIRMRYSFIIAYGKNAFGFECYADSQKKAVEHVQEICPGATFQLVKVTD